MQCPQKRFLTKWRKALTKGKHGKGQNELCSKALSEAMTRRPLRTSSEADCPAARARWRARTSSSFKRTVVEMRAIHSPYNKHGKRQRRARRMFCSSLGSS